jgi:asparagine synthase (glutamine-hydrolysing)
LGSILGRLDLSGYGWTADDKVQASFEAHFGSLSLFADVYLYDGHDLAFDLDLSPRDCTDALKILRAYSRWGPECLKRLNGDFTFAIYDRVRHEVFFARDHIGTKPLFWSHSGDKAFFSTSLQGLLEIRDCAWQLSQERLARFLHNPLDAPHESFIKGVEALGPGHWVRICKSKVTRERWWKPENLPERSCITPKAAEEELRHLTRRAVEVRLPPDGAVGGHFSGGVDSTLVTLMATEILRTKGSDLAAAYTWSPPFSQRDPDMGRHDERRLISAQCETLGVPLRFGGATGKTFETLVQQPFELQGTADLMDELPVIEKAQADGLKVMLSGWGGDEVFSNHGIGHLAWLLRHGHLGSVLRVARRYGGGLRRPHRMASFLWEKAVVPMLPDRFYSRFNPFVDLYGEGAFPSREMKLLYRELEKPTPSRIVADADAYIQSLLLNGHIGERMATWAAWAEPAGFEYRYPLTDRRLMEFVLSLPRSIRFVDGTGRNFVRKAFSDILPKGVNKADPANERRRLENRLAYWQTLSAEAKKGRFDLDCPWLDMPALRRAILQEPPAEKLAQISTFARIFVAVRAYEMYRRYSQ